MSHFQTPSHLSVILQAEQGLGTRLMCVELLAIDIQKTPFMHADILKVCKYSLPYLQGQGWCYVVTGAIELQQHLLCALLQTLADICPAEQKHDSQHCNKSDSLQIASQIDLFCINFCVKWFRTDARNFVATFTGNAQILTRNFFSSRLQDKIWEWSGSEARNFATCIFSSIVGKLWIFLYSANNATTGVFW